MRRLLQRFLGEAMVARLRAWQGAPRRRIVRSVVALRARTRVLDATPALVIAPHPDDEVFAAAGMLALKAQLGAEVAVAFLTDGEASHRNCCDTPPEEVARARRLLARQAGEALGLKPSALSWLGLPDGRLPRRGQEGFAAAATVVAEVLRAVAPNEVYMPHLLDCWPDHAAANEIAAEALGQIALPCTVHSYLVWGWYKLPLRLLAQLGLASAWRLSIAPVLPAKRRAIRSYCEAVSPRCGKPYVGVLPPGFAALFECPSEVFFASHHADPSLQGAGETGGRPGSR